MPYGTIPLKNLTRKLGMSEQCRDKLLEATLKVVKEDHAANPNRPPVQFRGKSGTLSRRLLEQEGDCLINVESSRYAWPKDQHTLASIVAEIMYTQNYHQCDMSNGRLRKTKRSNKKQEQTSRNRRSTAECRHPAVESRSETTSPAPANSPVRGAADTPETSAKASAAPPEREIDHFHDFLSATEEPSSQGYGVPMDVEPGESAYLAPGVGTFILGFNSKDYEMTAEQLDRATRFTMALYGGFKYAVRRAVQNGKDTGVVMNEFDEFERDVEARLHRFIKKE